MKLLILAFYSLFMLTFVQAQSVKLSTKVVNSAGWYQKGDSLIVIHSIGETLTQTFTNSSSNLTIKQGFLQPGISIHTGLDEEFRLALSIYPNPTHQQLNVKGELTYQEILTIYDINGRELIKQPLRLGESISVENLSPGVYQIIIVNPKNQAWYAAKIEKR